MTVATVGPSASRMLVAEPPCFHPRHPHLRRMFFEEQLVRQAWHTISITGTGEIHHELAAPS